MSAIPTYVPKLMVSSNTRAAMLVVQMNESEITGNKMLTAPCLNAKVMITAAKPAMARLAMKGTFSKMPSIEKDTFSLASFIRN